MRKGRLATVCYAMEPTSAIGPHYIVVVDSGLIVDCGAPVTLCFQLVTRPNRRLASSHIAIDKALALIPNHDDRVLMP